MKDTKDRKGKLDNHLRHESRKKMSEKVVISKKVYNRKKDKKWIISEKNK